MVLLILRQHGTSSTVAGAIVGGEGLFALALPLVLGPLSDRTRTRIGPRFPFILIALPLCVGGLLAIPLAGSLSGVSISVLVFFVGCYVYYSPYLALFPDFLPSEQLGRAQGVQKIFREVGLGVALVGSPLLFGVWRPLPFIAAAAVFGGITVTFVLKLRQHARTRGSDERRFNRCAVRIERRLARSRTGKDP